MGRRLAEGVNIALRDPQTQATLVFEGGQEVPDDLAEAVTNEAVWAEGSTAPAKRTRTSPKRAAKPSKGSSSSSEGDPAGGGPKPPPRGGEGSGLDAWTAYAAEHDVEVPDGATREQVIELLEAADVPTE